MKRKYDILTAFDTGVDILIRGGDVVPEFSQKEKLIGYYEVELGGSNCIFACQAAKLGLKTIGVGKAGRDAFGRLMIEKMSEAGIDTSLVQVTKEEKTGMSLGICRENDRAILTYTGTMDAAAPDMMTDALLASCRHLHIGSYFITSKIAPHYPDICRRAKSLGLTISLDTNWDPCERWEGGVENLFPYIDILMPNENEIRFLSKQKTVKDAIAFFRERIPIIALKLGADGARVISGPEEYSRLPFGVGVVDTVGAGDSFDAGFLYGFLNHYPLEKCLKIASFCGSMNTTKSGGIAGQPDQSQLFEFLQLS